MTRLYLAIIYLCYHFGEINGLLPLAEKLGMEYHMIDRCLRRIEDRDRRLRVIRRGRGRRMHISYDFDSLMHLPSIQANVKGRTLEAITFPAQLLYREDHGTRRPDESERHPHPVGA